MQQDYENSKKLKKSNFKKKKCRVCPGVTFASENEYLLHIKDQHRGKTVDCYMCSDCGKQFKTRSELNHHINSKCGTVKRYKCTICSQELMTAGSLHNHRLRHEAVRSFMCRFCAKLFLTAGQLKVHERIHTHDKAFVCEVCGKGFCHRQSLITHSTLHTGIKPYQCENCGDSFSCVGNLIKHRRTHSDTCGLIPLTTHTVQNPATKVKVKINTPANARLKTLEKEKQLQQKLATLEIQNVNSENQTDALQNGQQNNRNTCTKQNSVNNNPEPSTGDSLDLATKTSSKYEPEVIISVKDDSTSRNVAKNQKQDVSKCETEKKQKMQCKYCMRAYSSAKSLSRHEKKHAENKTEPNKSDNPNPASQYKCSCCKAAFNNKDECVAHQHNTHFDALTCHDCDKIFANPDSLRSHQNIFHKGLPRKVYLYVCEKCGKQFKQKMMLKHHEENNCGTGPLFQCQVCSKHFSSIHTCRSHMRVHDPEKKLLCKFCGKSFHWKGQLKIHERSHTGEKPFTCLYCPKAFAYRESLITHSSLHTGIKPHLCEACGSRFSCIGNLLKHRSTHASTCGLWQNKSQK